MLLDAPSKYPNSVVVTSETTILPLASDANALETAKSSLVIVVAAPVIVACFPLIAAVFALISECALPTAAVTKAVVATCVESVPATAVGAVGTPVNAGLANVALVSSCPWTELVTPSKYPNSVDVTSETTILPLALDASTLKQLNL